MKGGCVYREGQEKQWDVGNSCRWGPGGKGTHNGAKMWGMAVDGAWDGAETQGVQRGGV